MTTLNLLGFATGSPIIRGIYKKKIDASGLYVASHANVLRGSSRNLSLGKIA